MDKNTKNYLIIGTVLLLVYFLYNRSNNNNEHGPTQTDKDKIKLIKTNPHKFSNVIGNLYKELQNFQEKRNK